MGKPVFKKCSQCDCGEKRFIVNKRHDLCDEKNKQRLDDNSGGVRKKRQQLLAKSLLKPGKRKLKLSKKKVSTNTSYKEVCEQIADERGMQCQGCDTHDRLSFSHLVPRGRRPDLIDNPINIHIHCMDGDGIVGCHTKYEGGKWNTLKDKNIIIQALKQLDVEYLNLKLMKNVG